jgi:hypothetical protein
VRRLFSVVLVCTCVFPATVFSQRIEAYGDGSRTTKFVAGPPVSYIHLFAYADGTNGLNAVRFFAPVPDCWENAVWTGDSWNFVTIAGDNSQTGLMLGFGACQQAEVYLGYITVVSTVVPTNCCQLTILPDPGGPTGMLEFYDCDDVLHTRSEGGSVYIGDAVRIENLYPPDGATGLALDTKLSWEISSCCPIGLTHDSIRFGTTPDPDVVDMDVGTTWDPGPLLPWTTYYWQFGVDYCQCEGASGRTPVLSFTTTGPNAVAPTTWGAVKALYN